MHSGGSTIYSVDLILRGFTKIHHIIGITTQNNKAIELGLVKNFLWDIIFMGYSVLWRFSASVAMLIIAS
jgi:hypothetical protein